MQILDMKQTEYTPKIFLDPQKNIFEFYGESYPENTFEFYEPVLQWFEEFFQQKRDVTLSMELTYLNSSSLKSFFDIFEILNKSVFLHNSTIKVLWIYDYENDISLELGKNMDEDFPHVSVEFIQKSDT